MGFLYDPRFLTACIIEAREVNPVEWWKTNSHRFPTLARMARDYLSIPATSVPAECLFSQAGDLITKKRNRLLETSSSARLLLVHVPLFDHKGIRKFKFFSVLGWRSFVGGRKGGKAGIRPHHFGNACMLQIFLDAGPLPNGGTIRQ
jgi:hypothetical protein